jgi:anthranilate synthase component II
MIDNYDSFTFNLVHYLQQLSTDKGIVDVLVKRNDQISLSEIELLNPTHIVISPGPCNPNKAGLCLKIVEKFHQVIPILGVCLGHQVIGQFFAAKVIKAQQVVHGKTSSIYHSNSGVFSGLAQGFSATRYHSLVLDKNSIPECLEITAWTEKSGQIEHVMGIKHQDYPVEGVQFHPESVLSEHGLTLLRRFISSN